MMDVPTVQPSKGSLPAYDPQTLEMPSLPRGPVLGWSNFRRVDAPGISSMEDLPHIAFTTSGRAAIYQALQQLQMPAGTGVLVPTYHCPTMVAPILVAGHEPVYFGIRPDGLPDIQNIPEAVGHQARAMIVSHYFGLAQSLSEVRGWCDAHGIALIEDCAHCYFGQAGERSIGAWGDFSTASLSKFFPVPEAGLLGSASRVIAPMQFSRPSFRSEVKGWVDVLETSSRYGHLHGLNRLLNFIFGLKQKTKEPPAPQVTEPLLSEAAMMAECDMARINQRPLLASKILRRLLPRGRIIAQRQSNFNLYARLLAGLPGSRLLVTLQEKPVAPYVFPLWVDDSDRVYQALRAMGLPVFRWDRIWPNTPVLPGDVGPGWSRHVIQLLCHQELVERDVRRICDNIRLLLGPG